MTECTLGLGSRCTIDCWNIELNVNATLRFVFVSEFFHATILRIDESHLVTRSEFS
jgi:hypothetical protein